MIESFSENKTCLSVLTAPTYSAIKVKLGIAVAASQKNPRIGQVLIKTGGREP